MLLKNYDPFFPAFVKGEGRTLTDSKGKTYLDFASGVAVTGLGHSDPDLVRALSEQAKNIWHVSNFFHIEAQEECAEQLLAASPFAQAVFFCNSGAEANEAMLKLARRTHYLEGQAQRYRTITFHNAFHGRTFALIAAAGKPEHLEGFGPPMDGFDCVPIDDDKILLDAIDSETAAILIEPIQGDGGVRVIPHERLRFLRQVCDEKGLLLLFDEIQCGCARTGRFWAHEWAGVQPDILSSAKGLGNGIPVGAVLAAARCKDAFAPGCHGSTYGGNTLAMQVVKATLRRLTEPAFLAGVVERSALFRRKLEALQQRHSHLIAEVRGMGFMLGLALAQKSEKGAETRCSAQQFVLHALHEGLVVVPSSDNVVRLLPPLTITEQEIEQGLDRLEKTCVASSQ